MKKRLRHVPATQFKAECLALLDQVHDRGEPILITKRGRVVARLEPAGDVDERPWEELRGTVEWHGDPFAPVLDEEEIEALK
jgi:prevent-host-death family protein